MNSFEEMLLKLISNNQFTKAININCPYVELHSHPDVKQHLGIELVPPFRYHCWVCETKGSLVYGSLLKDLNVSDETIVKFLKFAETEMVESSRRPIFSTRQFFEFDFNFPFVKNKQLEYLENRYDKKFSKNEVEKYKIMLDPVDYLNKYETTMSKVIDSGIFKTKEGKIFDFNNSICFISDNNNILTCRAIDNSSFRYLNVRINGQYTETSPYIINVAEPNLFEYEIIMAEGIFDIIGVYEKFYKNEDNSERIFVASLGKGYLTALIYLAKKCIFPSNIIIYSDSSEDVKDYTFKEIKRHQYFKNNKIIIYKNQIEKDYGVPENKIEIKKYGIL